MILVRPMFIDNPALASSNVAEADYAAWAVGTTYALGDRVIYVSPSATVTISVATPAVITWASHGLANDTPIVFSTTGALPTGLSAGVVYYVRDKLAGSFNVSLKKGGAKVSTSGTQSGTHTATGQIHNIYESLQAANTGNYPLISSTWWLEVGATNRWAMFDTAVSSQTTNADLIKTVITSKGREDSVAVFNVSAASARFTQADSATTFTATISNGTPGVVTKVAHGLADGDKIILTTDGALPTGLDVDTVYFVVNKTDDTFEPSLTLGGASIDTTSAGSGTHTVWSVTYDNTYSMVSDSGIIDWYAYYFEPIVRIQDFAELEMPPLYESRITVTLAADGESVACGTCVVGQRLDTGDTQYGASVGIKDYSIKTQDTFGNWNIVERGYSKRANFQVWMDGTRIDYLQGVLAQYRSTPLVYIGSQSYTSTMVYGYYRDFAIDISYPTKSICSIEVESLI